MELENKVPVDIGRRKKKIAEVELYIDQESDKEDIHFVGINSELSNISIPASILVVLMGSAKHSSKQCMAKPALMWQRWKSR